jgi:hypothetical protein
MKDERAHQCREANDVWAHQHREMKEEIAARQRIPDIYNRNALPPSDPYHVPDIYLAHEVWARQHREMKEEIAAQQHQEMNEIRQRREANNEMTCQLWEDGTFASLSPTLPPQPFYHGHTAARSSTPIAISTATPPTNVANGITTAPTTTNPITAREYKPQPSPRIVTARDHPAIVGIRDHPYRERFLHSFDKGYLGRDDPEHWIHRAVQEYWWTGPDGQQYNLEHTHAAVTITRWFRRCLFRSCIALRISKRHKNRQEFEEHMREFKERRWAEMAEIADATR